MGAVNGFQIGSGQFGTTGGQILGAISPTTGTAPAGAIPLINSNQIGAATGTNSLFGLGSTAVNSTAGVVGSYMGPTPVNAHQGAPYMGSDAATAANATGCSISNISGCNPFK